MPCLSVVSKRLGALFFLFLALSVSAAAQTYSKPACTGGKNTTTISGVVYTPNGLDPLPDVLVYIPNGAPVAITDGANCTDLRPNSTLAQTTTAFDGSFVLTDVPAGTNVPLVIQSGKWQRVLTIATVNACQSNPLVDPANDKFARFPRTQAEGNIPRIAIVTGSVETSECVLRRVGIADSEFTNPTGTGRIHLYAGSKSSGATIDVNTPGEMTLMSTPAQLNGYDMLLFPCQGTDQSPTAAEDANLVSFANAGGRVFVNHHSHGWLRNNTGFTGPFLWASTDPGANAGSKAATIIQSFTTGATLAYWLNTIGATTGTVGQISVDYVGATLSSVDPITGQTWITLNSTNAPIQATFDTPVGSPAGTSCGRVLYNEYHVSNASSHGSIFPAECPTGTMTPQEKMFEFSLFDLSSFAPIVKVDPDMTVSATPNPVRAGGTVTMTATLSIPAGGTTTPTGGVTFSEVSSSGSTISSFGAVALHAGVATTTLSSLSSGTHIIRATYSGDPYYNSHYIDTTVIVYPPATIAVAATPNPVAVGHTTTVTATLGYGTSAPVPTGTVSFYDGSALISTTSVSGSVASFSSANFTNGAHVITAVYSGDTNYDSVRNSFTLYVQVGSATTVTEAQPSVFLSNAAVFTATITGSGGLAATGTVTFYEGTNPIGTAIVSGGVGTLSISTLNLGQHVVSASYSGDDYYAGSASANSVTENVVDFAMVSTSDTDPSVVHGGTATYTFTVTPTAGALPSDITFTLAGTRYKSIVTFTPDKAAAGTANATITLKVQTPSYPTLAPGDSAALREAAGVIALGMLLLPFSRRMREGSRKMRGMMMALVLLAGVLATTALTGCGSGWPARDYQFTLTGTSGNLQHTMTLKLHETEK